MPLVSLDAAARRVAAGNKRIAVVGSTGAGKTTLARRLARQLDLTHVELEALHWDPNWTPTPTPVVRERTAAALGGASWAVDGNYSKVRDIVWVRADTVIWLDYSLPLILWHLSRRTFWRVITRVELWNGNRERFREQFFSREAIFLRALTTYRRKRREYPGLFDRPEHAHLTIVHLRSPRSTRRLLAAVNPSTSRLAADVPSAVLIASIAATAAGIEGAAARAAAEARLIGRTREIGWLFPADKRHLDRSPTTRRTYPLMGIGTGQGAISSINPLTSPVERQKIEHTS